MSLHIARAPHHLPAGEQGVSVIDTAEAKEAAAHWTDPTRVALSAFATSRFLYRETLVEAVSDVRALLAGQGGPYALRLLLVHLQQLCESRGAPHRDSEAEPAFWCWCQPYQAPTTRLGATG